MELLFEVHQALTTKAQCLDMLSVMPNLKLAGNWKKTKNTKPQNKTKHL